MRHHEGRSKGRGGLPWLIVAAGEAVSAGFLLVPDARVRLVPYLLLFAAGSVNALAAGRSLSGSRLRFLLVCGALFRATLCLRGPDLSDDVFRFAWDGRVAAAGVSPYALPPDDPALSGIAPELKPRVGHRDARTVYPPVAQAIFRAGALARPREVLALKTLFALADLAVVALVYRLGGPTSGFAAALYAFHPLPITESAGQGHCDALGVALLLASLAHLSAGRRARAGVAFALSVLTKYVSGAAVLPLLRRGRLAATAAFFLAVLGLWLAAAAGGASPAGGIGIYATRWDFNSVIYKGTVAGVEALELPERAKQLFLVLKEKLGHPAWAQKVFPFFYPAFFARAVLGLILFAALLWIDRRRRSGGAEPAVFASLAALTLLSPTLHPWYVLWVLPLAARAKDSAFLYLAGVVPLSYALLYPVSLLPAPLVYTVEFGPFAVLLAFTLRHSLPLRAGEGRSLGRS